MLTQTSSTSSEYREDFQPEAALEKPRIFLADDHFLVLESLSLLLAPHFSVVGVTSNGRSVLQEVERLQPAIALLDITMPETSGLELAKAIAKAAPDTKVVFLTMHASPRHMAEAFNAGACGYILKSSAASELITALRTVLSGGTYRSTQLAAGTAMRAGGELSERQRTVLSLVAEGQSAKQVAYQLGISQRTAEFHKACIMDKLKMRTTAELIRYALAHGLTT
jgi:DNA-binding NarL/FixJ family response regulator